MNPRYLARRLLQVLPAVAGILVVSFVLIHLAPGDPVDALAGEGGDVAYYEFMRSKFGLDRPLPAQFVTYAGNVFRGDLGVSFIHGRPALEVIVERLPATLLLMGTAAGLSTLIGVALGVLAARRPFGRLDTATNVGSIVAHAVPYFLLSQMALLVFAHRAGLFPVHGMTDPRGAASGFSRALDVAHHLALPALVLSAHHLALVVRLTRTNLLGELGKEYVRGARARGLSERRVLLAHALPGALLPTITVVGARLGFLFAGTAVVEIVFGWPGMGRLLLSATQTRDYPVLLGIFLFVAFAVVVANLVTDLVYGRLDPRIRYG